MPYKAFSDGGKWKVYKIDADSQPVGDPLGTHDNEADAKKQVAALYANEADQHAAISKREDVTPADKKAATKEYGDVKFADAVNNKYPLDSEQHVRSAWSYIGQAKNQEPYSPAEVKAIKARIIAAWKKLIDPDGPPGAENHGAEYVLFEDAQYSEFVKTAPGTPYRLFPFGTIYKGGIKRTITPEYAAQFKLPHFRPPIKLGSHDERCPAGGQIVGLEVRQDGLYAIPEFTEKGQQSLADGDYRYHSPEVIWEGEIENPTDGKAIAGPLIVGDALLHTPHLGEAAALYSFEINSMKGDTHMAEDEMVSVPKSIFDRFLALFDKRTAEPEPAPETPKSEPETPAAQVVELDKFEALKAERDTLEAERKAAVEKLAAIEAEKVRAEMLQGIVAQLQDQGKFGMQFVQLKDAEEAAGVLGGMDPAAREWCMRMFSALASKVNTSALYSELGSNGAGVDDPEAALDAAIKAKAAEKQVDYTTALNMVRAEKPELFAAMTSKKEAK